jgi:hypothetical protein
MVWLCHDLGSGSWAVDQAGGVVTGHLPRERDHFGRTLQEALSTRLIWLMAWE